MIHGRNRREAMTSEVRAPYRRVNSAPPTWVPIAMGMVVAFLTIPIVALMIRGGTPGVLHTVLTKASLDALSLSVRTCVASTIIAIVAGTPVAIWLARAPEGIVPTVVRLLVTLPMVLPPVVAGIALLSTWGRYGLIGRGLDIFGVTVAFTTMAVVIAQVFVSVPFVVTSLESAIRARGHAEEDEAAVLGASRRQILTRVTIPLMIPALTSATALAFARSAGEFGATLTFAGSLQGVTRTLPLEIYLQREVDTDSAVALSVVLLAVAFFALLVSRLLASPRVADAIFSLAHAWRSGREDRFLSRARIDSPGTGDGVSDAIPRASSSSIGCDAHVTVPQRGVDVTVSIEPGVTTAITGPNGSGKTTLLSALASTLDVDDDAIIDVRWWEDDAQALPREEGQCERIAREIGTTDIVVLAQRPVLFRHMSVIANVAFALECRGVARTEARRRARAELERWGLGDTVDAMPMRISGGQAQRTALARAFVTTPKVVLLDEPSVALDAASVELFRTQVRARCRGITTVLVTHDPRDVEALADRVIALS